MSEVEIRLGDSGVVARVSEDELTNAGFVRAERVERWRQEAHEWAQASMQNREALEAVQAEIRQWLSWSDGRYPDTSPGDVISWDWDGTIVLDDGITTWNPLRALAAARKERDEQPGHR